MEQLFNENQTTLGGRSIGSLTQDRACGMGDLNTLLLAPIMNYVGKKNHVGAAGPASFVKQVSGSRVNISSFGESNIFATPKFNNWW
mmetsp:Transcript_16716/g.30265  ORF Transcript_16716/g.30265 Transcript_16716/m.30265 type:complete len:87 (+) Transcript_16716:405-665(+)